MNHLRKYLVYVLMSLLAINSCCAQKESKYEKLITISTQFGEMKIILFDETPKHKANFIKLAEEGFYDSTLFHRIINGFMIQGGDPDSKNAKPGQVLGNGDVGYKIPAEFNEKLFHKKGAIAAARDTNPQKESSGCQFYIVHGTVVTDQQLNGFEKRTGKKFSDAKRKAYTTIGGSSHLDGGYTVFGEVIAGIEILDKIATQPKDNRDRPLKNITMSVSVEKMKKKEITKIYDYGFKKQ
ncbi:MAG: peptidylprolyl isomerase [Bacteroidetes bacterium]|nr:peptidylprolyl isomerase [Bacteroidota bacterium]